ncbi:MAG: hypothetical protein GEU97_09435 [Actinophytocola sp.]|nr:hypothetical protein [Actinophytocola sp.]
MQTALDDATVPDVPVADLIARSGELKREIVAFARRPPFERSLTGQLRDAAERRGVLDDAAAVAVIDQFIHHHRLPGGDSVLERFVARRRPQLPPAERDMLLGWLDPVEAVFEVAGFDDDAVVLHNLLDDLRYRVRSNMGAETFAGLSEGMFVEGRIVPVHPAVDEWLVSGHFSTYPMSSVRLVAQAAAQVVMASPGLLYRNPERLRRSWEMQERQRQRFIEFFGSDLVILPPADVKRQMTEYYLRLRAEAAGGDPAAEWEAEAEELAAIPDDLLDAETVALIYDEVEGLNYYAEFGSLDELFADPSLVKDKSRIARLRTYLRDDSVSPLAIRRLVQRHADGADHVFRKTLGKPNFVWERDGENLLRKRKKEFFDSEPTPSVFTIGDRLTELLRETR